MALGPESRTQIKMDLERKRKASKAKKAKRKYRDASGEIAEDEDADVEEGCEDIVPGLVEGQSVEGAVAEDAKIKEGEESTVEGEELPEWERKWRELRGIK